jgi:hypothetical protein
MKTVRVIERSLPSKFVLDPKLTNWYVHVNKKHFTMTGQPLLVVDGAGGRIEEGTCA